MIIQSQQQATLADGISSFHLNICQLFILVRVRQTQLCLQIGNMVPVLVPTATFVFRRVKNYHIKTVKPIPTVLTIKRQENNLISYY
jgi:hypothetical protein